MNDKIIDDKKLQKAIDHFNLEITDEPNFSIASEYTLEHATELIYCYENNKSILDFDAWTAYENILDEKISFEEYSKLNKELELINVQEIDMSNSTEVNAMNKVLHYKLETIRGNETRELFQEALKNIEEVKTKFNQFIESHQGEIQFEDVIKFTELELGSFPSNDFIDKDEYFVDFNYGAIAGTLLKEPAHELKLQKSFDVWKENGYNHFEGMTEEKIKDKIQALSYESKLEKFQGHFLNDEEKMMDFFSISKEDFLFTYSYLTEQDYEDTVQALNVIENSNHEGMDASYDLERNKLSEARLLNLDDHSIWTISELEQVYATEKESKVLEYENFDEWLAIERLSNDCIYFETFLEENWEDIVSHMNEDNLAVLSAELGSCTLSDLLTAYVNRYKDMDSILKQDFGLDVKEIRTVFLEDKEKLSDLSSLSQEESIDSMEDKMQEEYDEMEM